MLFSAYLSFADTNNSQIEEPYKSIFSNISSNYSAFSTIGGQVKDEGLVRNIYRAGANLITGTVNVFVTGLDAMGKFFLMIPVLSGIISAIGFGIPGLGALNIMLGLILGVYIAMRYIQSVSNKTDLP